MLNKLKLTVAMFAFAVAGCAGTLPSTPPVDAVAAKSRFDVPVQTQFGGRVTGRDWNCKGCYRG